jgi:formate--tetrahydrofolate ligase
MASDIEIARAATMTADCTEIGDRIGVPAEDQLMQVTARTRPRSRSDFIKSLQDRPDGKLILVTAINPTPGGRRQDDDDRRPRRRPEPHRQEGDDLPARTLARPVLRREGRRGRRRLCPGRADGGHQPPLHRRLPRHHLRAQPAVGADRQPHLLGQRARHRRASHHLAPRDGHERPRAARQIVSSLGGVANGFPREAGFDITVASEVMAILCLSDGSRRICRSASATSSSATPATAPPIYRPRPGRPTAP